MTSRTTALAFSDVLHGALDVAVLSPSSHNCQPWCVALLESGPARRAAATVLGGPRTEPEPKSAFLVLAIDRERRLGALPAHALEMGLSCGLYWRLLQRALDAQGWTLARSEASPQAAALFDVWLPDTWEPLCVAEFRPGGEPSETLGDLRALARRRHTNRAPFDSTPVDGELLTDLARRARQRDEGRLPVVVRHLCSWPDRHRFARFVARHGGRDFAHDDAWRETHSYIRWSVDAASARGDGFALDHLFGPLPPHDRWLRRLALAPAAMTALSRVGYPRFLAGQLAAVVQQSPVVVLMSLPVKDPDPPETLSAAAALADYWLDVTRAGLVLHPISIVIQHEDVRRALQRTFATPGRVFFVARLGRPSALFPASPRRPATAAFRTL
ncbi:RedV protein [Actinomadura spongiicola]|uniref:RedV protein n=1 Tax=Actinomadura spongiicola TaxID=2303421 RepID=A0A372G9Z9_9ACTN|nr:RedV protein [Actinomadura spongiicola]RFS82218.1 RedV protein [Actinomadura spongiicola]